METLRESFTARRRILVFATTLEKDVDGMLRVLLPEFDDVVLTRYRNNARAVPVEELARLATAQCTADRTGHWQIASDPATAWQAVHALKPNADDLICVTGSFFLLGQMRKAIEAAPLALP